MIPQTTSRVVDTNRTLSIVVAHYNEPIPALLETLNHILALNAVTDIPTSLHLYTKHPTTSTKDLASSLDAITPLLVSAPTVQRLPNLGREGGTYLHHMLNNSLSTHTMFLQAEVHNERAMLKRLEDYFIEETGFLSIGFSGKGCDLGSCMDSWGWRDRFGHLSWLYTKMFATPPPVEGRMVLSYKGQFIVSRARVEEVLGEKKEGGGKAGVLKELQEMLEGEESPFSRPDPGAWARGREATKNDDRSSPSFGYTLERMWGMVFSCADGRFLESCPDLWSRRYGGEIDGCQCLDVVR